MQAYGITDVGKVRLQNQDYIYLTTDKIGNLPNLFIVADGMGGHKAGELASQVAVERFIEFVKTTDLVDIHDIINEGITAANREVYRLSMENEIYRGMGTTFVVAVIENDKLVVANIGDSRAYIANEEEIKKITIDHSIVEEMIISGQITEEEARNHPKRNNITRAIGVLDEVEIDFFEYTLQEEDSIILCSDGLSNMLTNNMMRVITRGYDNPIDKVKHLFSKANGNGGTDNISVIVIDY